MLFQAYYGYYSYRQWSDFEQPLTRRIDKSPKVPSWERQVKADPKFRRVLQSDGARAELAQTINSLSKKGKHIAAYADLTGITHNKQSIAKVFRVVHFRLDLNQLLFPPRRNVE